jgi:hypothetical protein
MQIWFEKVMKWWKTKYKRSKRTNIRKTPTRYYVYGTKHQMHRVVHKRVSNYTASTIRTYLISQVKGELDSTWLGIDMLSTYCMTNDKEDFVGHTKPMDEKVLGVSNDRAKITMYGEGRYLIQDDQGVQCELPISESYYCESVPYKVLSPQHIDKLWRGEGTGTFSEVTDSCSTIIMWQYSNGTKHTKRISHTNKSGIPLCQTAPKYKSTDNH